MLTCTFGDRNVLLEKYSQKPQLSSSHPIVRSHPILSEQDVHSDGGGCMQDTSLLFIC